MAALLAEFIRQKLDHFLLDEDVKGQLADKGEEAEKLTVLLRRVGEDPGGVLKLFCHILLQLFPFFLLQGEDLPVDFGELRTGTGGKMLFAERGEELLDLAEGNHILVVIDEDQHQNVVAGIFLFDRRGKKPVLGIVVDHGFCDHHLVLTVTGARKALVHKGGHLVHIEVNIRDIPGVNVCETVHVGHEVLQSLFIGLIQ